jgi:hypothetical protein
VLGLAVLFGGSGRQEWAAGRGKGGERRKKERGARESTNSLRGRTRKRVRSTDGGDDEGAVKVLCWRG